MQPIRQRALTGLSSSTTTCPPAETLLPEAGAAITTPAAKVEDTRAAATAIPKKNFMAGQRVEWYAVRICGYERNSNEELMLDV